MSGVVKEHGQNDKVDLSMNRNMVSYILESKNGLKGNRWMMLL